MPATLQSRRMPQLFSALRLLDRHTVMKSALVGHSGADDARRAVSVDASTLAATAGVEVVLDSLDRLFGNENNVARNTLKP